jgi:hypothetical protein
MLWISNSNSFLIFKSTHFDTCIRTPRSSIQVHQTKFIVVMIKLRENFSEFTRFVPQGMNPFKIHGKFKLEYVPEFITWIMLRIWDQPNWESCSKYSNLASHKVYIFSKKGKASILNLFFLLSLNIGRKFKLGWTHLSAAHFIFTAPAQ